MILFIVLFIANIIYTSSEYPELLKANSNFTFNEWFYFVYYLSIMLCVIVSMLGYYTSESVFHTKMWSHRKTLYFVFILFMGFGSLSKTIDLTDWKSYLTHTIIIVFIDIALYQTPKITKLWNTELKEQQESTVSAIENLKEILDITANKINKFSDILLNIETDTYFKNSITYEDFIKEYTSPFNYAITFIVVGKVSDVEDTLFEELKKALSKLETMFSVRISNNNKQIKELVQSKHIVIQENHFITFVIEVNQELMLVALKSNNGNKVDVNDHVHIMNLSKLYTIMTERIGSHFLNNNMSY